MTVDLEHPMTIGDRYASATTSKNLTPRTRGITDADVLLAAGIAASGDRDRMLALTLYRVGVTGDKTSLPGAIDELEEWMLVRITKTGGRTVPRAARRALLVAVVRWWFDRSCGYCNGIGKIELESTSRLTDQSCSACHGSGKRPLVRDIPHAHSKHAEWIVKRLDELVAMIHNDMAALLSQRLDL